MTKKNSRVDCIVENYDRFRVHRDDELMACVRQQYIGINRHIIQKVQALSSFSVEGAVIDTIDRKAHVRYSVYSMPRGSKDAEDVYGGS
jgi:hypothetical protein